MLKQKVKNLNNNIKIASVLCLSLLLIGGTAGFVRADQYDEQIRALQQQNESNQAASNDLANQASSYQDAINKLEQQINALQQSIVDTQLKSQEIERQIAQAQAELDQQKKVLSESIASMYVEGQISPLEILASSNDISDYVNKQAYRNSVQSQVKTTLDKINSLKTQLVAQQRELEVSLADLKNQQSQLSTTQYEQNQMLAYTEGQKATYDQQIKNNKSKIAELRRQQIAANARFIGAPGSGTACGGGYPGSAPGPWGRWGCNYAMDNTIDPWGMYNRQCVSYTAFKVEASGRYMPYWGGYGNANQWDDNARRMGIPVDSNPQPGDVAVSNSGYYGHVMYVEAVYDDGRILVSQYNAGWTGLYSEAVINVGNLVFIHF
jgi:peptidoglycan DL-endopeptidase CwlO